MLTEKEFWQDSKGSNQHIQQNSIRGKQHNQKP